ncbi:MAG: hypothetical protein WC752_02190 [Patescibacteria group bacterium]|jgi:hypothetical protein
MKEPGFNPGTIPGQDKESLVNEVQTGNKLDISGRGTGVEEPTDIGISTEEAEQFVELQKQIGQINEEQAAAYQVKLDYLKKNASKPIDIRHLEDIDRIYRQVQTGVEQEDIDEGPIAGPPSDEVSSDPYTVPHGDSDPGPIETLPDDNEQVQRINENEIKGSDITYGEQAELSALAAKQREESQKLRIKKKQLDN